MLLSLFTSALYDSRISGSMFASAGCAFFDIFAVLVFIVKYFVGYPSSFFHNLLFGVCMMMLSLF